MSVLLKSENLAVKIIPPPGQTPVNRRFDSSCMIESVLLNGKHSFCVPEQPDPSRRSTRGVGLCSEFVWNDIAREAGAGRPFPKLGVGLLTQPKAGAPYDIWTQYYEVAPFHVRVTLSPDRAVFVQEAEPCLGISAVVYREAAVWKNTLTVSTTIENAGYRSLELTEYNHNFIAIDGIPIGPGYRLKIPFDGEIAGISTSCFPRSGREPVLGALYAKEDTIYWKRAMTQLEFSKQTQARGILPLPRYYWRLSHKDSDASVEETVSFAPARLGLWGVGHCVCPELFVEIRVPPGGKQSWSRTWIFRDDKTS